MKFLTNETRKSGLAFRAVLVTCLVAALLAVFSVSAFAGDQDTIDGSNADETTTINGSIAWVCDEAKLANLDNKDVKLGLKRNGVELEEWEWMTEWKKSDFVISDLAKFDTEGNAYEYSVDIVPVNDAAGFFTFQSSENPYSFTIADAPFTHTASYKIQYFKSDAEGVIETVPKTVRTLKSEKAEISIPSANELRKENKYVGYSVSEVNLPASGTVVVADVGADDAIETVDVTYTKINKEHSVSAQVKYFYGITLDDAKAQTKPVATDEAVTVSGWFFEKATVTPAVDKAKVPGYKFDGTSESSSFSVEAGADTDPEVHVVSAYFVKDENQNHSISAKIEYRFGDTLAAAKAKQQADASSLETASGWICESTTVTVAPNVTDQFLGYKYHSTEGALSYDLAADAATETAAHVVKVYYVKDDTQKHSVSAQIQYFKGDTLAKAKAKNTPDATEKKNTATTWAGEAAVVKVAPNTSSKFSGYLYNSTSGALSYTVAAKAKTDSTVHIVKVYYVKKPTKSASWDALLKSDPGKPTKMWPGGKTFALKKKSSSDKTTFKSSNTSVATVSSSGVITAKKAGTVTITMIKTTSTAYYKATFKFTVVTKAAAQKDAYKQMKSQSGKLKGAKYFFKQDVNGDGIVDVVYAKMKTLKKRSKGDVYRVCFYNFTGKVKTKTLKYKEMGDRCKVLPSGKIQRFNAYGTLDSAVNGKSSDKIIYSNKGKTKSITKASWYLNNKASRNKNLK